MASKRTSAEPARAECAGRGRRMAGSEEGGRSSSRLAALPRRRRAGGGRPGRGQRGRMCRAGKGQDETGAMGGGRDVRASCRRASVCRTQEGRVWAEADPLQQSWRGCRVHRTSRLRMTHQRRCRVSRSAPHRQREPLRQSRERRQWQRRQRQRRRQRRRQRQRQSRRWRHQVRHHATHARQSRHQRRWRRAQHTRAVWRPCRRRDQAQAIQPEMGLDGTGRDEKTGWDEGATAGRSGCEHGFRLP
jgi:hypothetical protein